MKGAISIILFIGSLFCILARGSNEGLEGCKLYVGGDFNYASDSNQLSGLMTVDATSGAVIPGFDGGSVYKDGSMDNLIQIEDHVFFSGDVVRAGEDKTMTIGSYNIDDDDFEGVDGGIWPLGNTLPTEDSAISPSLLFAQRDKKLIIAGQFKKLAKSPLESVENILEYDLKTKTLSELPGADFPCSDCSVISLTTGADGIFIATMDTQTFETTIYQYTQFQRWIKFSSPVLEEGKPITLLFDNLVVIEDSLFALGYYSDYTPKSLLQNDLYFYILRWNISEPTSKPDLADIWQKQCPTSAYGYPVMKPFKSNLLVAIPGRSCPIPQSTSDFTTFLQISSSNLSSIPNVPVKNLTMGGFASQMEISSKGEAFVSNGTSLYRLSSGGKDWKLLSKQAISSIHYSDSKSTLYVASSVPGTGGALLLETHGRDSDKLRTIFQGGLYSDGTILTVSPLANGQLLVGGDFKWIGKAPVAAKFAAFWDGSAWKATLGSNEDDFLPGWKLLSSASIGSVVFGIADAGPSPGKLPVVIWTEDMGVWQFLAHRPVLVADSKSYKPSIGVAYADHKRGKVYFGGEFLVQLYDGTVTEGVAVYTMENKSWSSLKANLTRVSAIGGLDGSELVQFGGKFQLKSGQDNYLVWEEDTRTIVSGYPTLGWSEVHAMGIFPGQPKASFLGGDFGDHGVEQLRLVNGKWTFSRAGSSSVPAVIYSLSARNSGNDLFAGGSIVNGLSRFDIVHQQWYPVLGSGVLFEGTVYSISLSCPSDVPYYSYGSELDYWENFDGNCHIEGNENVCSRSYAPLNGWQIFGLCLAVFVTFSIVAVIGFLILSTLRKQQTDNSQNFEVEFL